MTILAEDDKSSLRKPDFKEIASTEPEGSIGWQVDRKEVERDGSVVKNKEEHQEVVSRRPNEQKQNKKTKEEMDQKQGGEGRRMESYLLTPKGHSQGGNKSLTKETKKNQEGLEPSRERSRGMAFSMFPLT